MFACTQTVDQDGALVLTLRVTAAELAALSEDEPGENPLELLADHVLGPVAAALWRAVRGEADTPVSQPARPASDTDLCGALAEQTGCDPTQADKMVGHLVREGLGTADYLLSHGLFVAKPTEVGALLLAAAAKRLAG